jgi:hypothetical protein
MMHGPKNIKIRSEAHLTWKFFTEWNEFMLKTSIALFNYNIEKN